MKIASKNLIHPLPVQNEVVLAMKQQRKQKSRCVDGLWLFMVASFVTPTYIYREDPPRVRTSHNRLVLSIKHVLDMNS
jgi:hypothetical protein